jgi:gamma-glutamyltranspeptidase
VNVQAEIGCDNPWQDPNRVRPGKVARHLIIALIVGVLFGNTPVGSPGGNRTPGLVLCQNPRMGADLAFRDR